jgi:hypothetical protein
MAKKGKGKKHKPTKRRKRMGALNSDALMLLVGGIAGVVAGHVADTVFTGDSAYLAFGEIAGGGAVAYFPKQPLLKGFGIGLAGYGTMLALQTSGIMAGVMSGAGIDYGMTYAPTRKIAGYRDVPKVGDFPKPVAVGRVKPSIYAGVY